MNNIALDVEDLQQRAQKAAAFGNAVTIGANDLLLLIESRDEALESLALAEREIGDLQCEVDGLEKELGDAYEIIEGRDE